MHQTYIEITTGGSAFSDGLDADDAEPAVEGLAPAKDYFEPLPWGIESRADLEKLLEFGFRSRLTPFVRQLLALPCMALRDVGAPDSYDSKRVVEPTAQCPSLSALTEADHLDLLHLQAATSSTIMALRHTVALYQTLISALT